MKDRKCKFLRNLCKILHLLNVNDTALGLTCEDYFKVRKKFDSSKELDDVIVDRENTYFTIEPEQNKFIHFKLLKE